METSNMSDIVQRYNASTVLVCVNKTAASITKSSQIATDAAQSAVDNDNGGYNASVMLPALARELGKHYQRARRLLAAKGHKFMNYHCVPITRYAELRTAFAEVSDDYAKCVSYWTGSDAMYDKYVAECQELHKGLWCESLLPANREDYERQFSLKLTRCAMPSMPSNEMLTLIDQESFAELYEDISEDAHSAYRSLITAGIDAVVTELDALVERMNVADQKFSAKTFNALQNELEKLSDFAKIESDQDIINAIAATSKVVDECLIEMDKLNDQGTAGDLARSQVQSYFQQIHAFVSKLER